jgi:hypothetical protein
MDLTQVKIAGPQKVTFKGQDMGHTLEGIDLEVQREFQDVMVDKYGTMPIDKVLTGGRLRLTFKLAQSAYTQWNMAIPESSTIDGPVADRMDIGTDAGASLRTEAGLLVIHPLSRAISDLTDDITLYRAVSVEAIEVPYKNDEQKAIQITMEALVDEAYGSGRRLGHIGPADVS